MKQVMMYKTCDGEVFSTEEAASAHERDGVFRKCYERDPLCASNEGDPRVGFGDMCVWLQHNREIVLRFYGYEE